MGFETVRLLDINIACLDVQGLIAQVQKWSRQGETRTVFYANAHCFNVALRDPQYHQILKAADLVYADGIGVVWAGRYLESSQLVKMTGAKWIFDLCQAAQCADLRIYNLAGEPGIARLAGDNLRAIFPDLKIVGCSDGLFHEKSQAEVIKEINAAAAHILFVGMGVPKQEKWILEHRNRIDVPVCWGVGALFDFVAGLEPRVPAVLDSLALEWFWRLLMDPLGKWRRYVLGNPLFVYQVLREKISRRPAPML